MRSADEEDGDDLANPDDEEDHREVTHPDDFPDVDDPEAAGSAPSDADNDDADDADADNDDAGADDNDADNGDANDGAGGQICLNRHFPSSDRTGVSDAPFQYDEPGLSGGASRWSDLGELVFLGTPVPRGNFCSVPAPARPRAGGKIGKV